MQDNAKPYLEVAIGRQSLDEALHIADNRGRAVFGTMDGRVLEQVGPAFTGIPVYFYEPG